MCNPHLGHTLRRVAFGGKRGQKRSVHYRSGMGQHSRSRTTQSLRVGDTTLCWSGKAGSSTRKARDEIYLSICPPRNRQPSNISRSIPRAISSSTTTRHGSTTSVPKAPLPASCTSSGPPESASTATRTISPCTTHALQGEPRTPANLAPGARTQNQANRIFRQGQCVSLHPRMGKTILGPTTRAPTTQTIRFGAPGTEGESE
mmetsp:Transcript_61035/g.125892  ORF Transcript_61035/g.125892 Transcript_61035/m.125892 type:complete len:203 (-) Transcript_61035:274-882(-)